jgi:hypothetical protein
MVEILVCVKVLEGTGWVVGEETTAITVSDELPVNVFIMIFVSVSSCIISLFLPGWRLFEFIVHLSGRAGNAVSRKSWGRQVALQ